MTLEKFKDLIAHLLCALQIDAILLKFLNRKYSNNYIRIINYHGIDNPDNFEKQINYFSKKYQNITVSQLELFLTGELALDNPGLFITFDDGRLTNYTKALPILEKYNFTGTFFVVANWIDDKKDCMNTKQLKDLIERGHFVGSHTSTHYLFDQQNDSKQKLEYEIIESKRNIEKLLGNETDMFCWCGGKTNSYSYDANKMIKECYEYSFITTSKPITRNTDRFLLNRTNIESRWSIELVEMQLCGLIDLLYIPKRKRVEKILNEK